MGTFRDLDKGELLDKRPDDFSEQPLQSREERYAAGKALRNRLEREQHSKWTTPKDRRDPVKMVVESSKGRIPELLPIRYGRMMVSPFTFYRGTANIMAADLALTPATGIRAQLCGDCHLLNLGGFATPERRLIFDTNDFDETLPGPWEWDVKRLVASFVMASRSNGFSKSDQRDAAQTCAQSYREHMTEFASMPTLDVWYADIDVNKAMSSLHDKATRARVHKHIRKEMARQVTEHESPSMIQRHNGEYVIKDNPPLSITISTSTLRRTEKISSRPSSTTARRCRTIVRPCSTAIT